MYGRRIECQFDRASPVRMYRAFQKAWRYVIGKLNRNLNLFGMLFSVVMANNITARVPKVSLWWWFEPDFGVTDVRISLRLVDIHVCDFSLMREPVPEI
jgi:hypothetical protein